MNERRRPASPEPPPPTSSSLRISLSSFPDSPPFSITANFRINYEREGIKSVILRGHQRRPPTVRPEDWNSYSSSPAPAETSLTLSSIFLSNSFNDSPSNANEQLIRSNDAMLLQIIIIAMIILRGNIRDEGERERGFWKGIESQGGKGYFSGKGGDPAWTRKIAGSFRRAAGSLHCLKFQVVRVPVGQEVGPRPNMTRVRINRGETDVYRRRSGGIREKVRREGRGSRREGEKKGAQCRIISGLHTFRVSVHYVRSAACTKGVPDPKKGKKKERDAREKEEERGRWRAWKGRETGGYLAEIVMSCYYHARQLSRRNTRGPLPIKLSSRWESIARAQTHAENDLSSPLSSPPPQRQIKAERSNGPSRDQFARLSYIPIDLPPLVNS